MQTLASFVLCTEVTVSLARVAAPGNHLDGQTKPESGIVASVPPGITYLSGGLRYA